MTTFETAPGGPTRPELLCVGSSGGQATHLYDPVTGHVLGDCLSSETITTDPALAPFELNGCRRCAATATERGYSIVSGIDGDIALDGFVPFTTR